jgi:DNA polymerase (family X)
MKNIDVARTLAGLHGGGTGTLAVAEPEEEAAADLTELTELSGLGPKRARQLYDELGISTLAELGAALGAGHVARLKGFSPEMAERLENELQQLLARRRRFTLAEAEQQIAPVLEHLRAGPSVERVEVAGSVRRRRDTVGDVDILVISAKPAQVMRHLAGCADAEHIDILDSTRARLRLPCGLQACIRVVPRRCYGATLHYLTGSVDHNTATRELGLERGIRMSEYGVFRLDPGRAGARRIGGQREEDIFAALGLEWIPPELREHRGELEAGLQQRLPRLVTERDIRGDLHIHTTWSHAAAGIGEVVHACQTRGYEYCAITDYSHTLAAAHETGSAAAAQAVEIAHIRARLHGFHLLHGVEVGIRADGTLDADELDLDSYDIVLAGVHSHTRLSRTRMTDRILRALEHPAIHILTHPTGRVLGQRAAYDLDVDVMLAAAAALDVAVELNARPDRLDLDDLNVRRAHELGASVVINSAATSVAELDCMRFGIDQARRGWLEPGHVLNTRTWAELAGWLSRRGRHTAPRPVPR